MKTSHKMFLRRNTKRGHEEVLVTIDWDGLSQDDIKLMASHYMINRAAHDLKDYDSALPESVEYRAADFIHTEVLVQKDYVVPESWKAKKVSKAKQELEELLKGLSKEEINVLLSE